LTPASHFTQFGKYEIIRKLGRSMTDVYLALDPILNKRVVLKIVEQCRDSYTEIVVEAERRGAAIQQQLHALDPRVLEVYEFGDFNGCFFVAMEYAEGKSLAEVLRSQGRLDPERAARYIAEVCGQLTTLHSFQAEIDGHKRAVVHGDIKPANIQIGPNGEVRLLDFGIAKYITETRNLTAHNLGSPAYCSPERLQKAQVDPHADLWALGVCLYEAVGGAPPYQAQTTRKLENLIQSRRPPRALPDTCPVPLKAVIWKALAGDLTLRYSSAPEFLADLEAYLKGRATAAQRQTTPGWDANATVERQQPQRVTRLRAPPRKWSDFRERHGGALGALTAGVVVGILLFVPASFLYRFWVESASLRDVSDYSHASIQEIESDWNLHQRLLAESGFLRSLSPALRLTAPLRATLNRTGRDILEDYRNSSDPALGNFDWNKASYCFRRVLDIDGRDKQARGWLALSDGYCALARNSDAEAETKFREAAQNLPKAADPHIALARIYAWSTHNPGQAAAELSAAERLGFNPGPREFEQEGDAYLFRAEQTLRAGQQDRTPVGRRRLLAAASRDFSRARNLYEPIAGFSKVSDQLERLDKDESLAGNLQRVSLHKAKRVTRRKYTARYRRWR
jgi:serine/threonine protein kinase